MFNETSENVPLLQMSSPQQSSAESGVTGRLEQPAGVWQGRGAQTSSPHVHLHCEHAASIDSPSSTRRPSFDRHSPEIRYSRLQFSLSQPCLFCKTPQITNLFQ